MKESEIQRLFYLLRVGLRKFRNPTLRKCFRNLLVQQSPRDTCVFDAKILGCLGTHRNTPV